MRRGKGGRSVIAPTGAEGNGGRPMGVPTEGGGGIINAECQVMNGELGRVQRETDCHGRRRLRNDRVITECGGRIGLSAGSRP